MDRQRTYRGSTFDVGWVRGTLIYNNSPLSSTKDLFELGPYHYYSNENPVHYI